MALLAGADAWFQAANRRKAGQEDAGFPRRKRALVPVRCYHGTFKIDGQRVRLPVASGQPALWVRLARASRTRDAGRVQNLRLREWRRPTGSKPCATRLSKPGSWCGWWRSVAPPPPVPPAGGGSPSPRAGGSAVPIAPSRGTGIWSVPATSPRRLAADLRARTCLCSSSTVGPASCRHGVTDAATSTTSGAVGPAWPRATTGRSCVPWVSLATRPRPGAWRGSSSAAQQGKRCLKGH